MISANFPYDLGAFPTSPPQLCKTTNYRAGGWRRDLLRDELTNISPAELRDLGAAARAAQDQLLALYRQSHAVSVFAEII